MYDGRVGRWMTTDPYSQYHSPYLAMGNNPVKMIDPDGGFAFGGGEPPEYYFTLDDTQFGDYYATPAKNGETDAYNNYGGSDDYITFTTQYNGQKETWLRTYNQLYHASRFNSKVRDELYNKYPERIFFSEYYDEMGDAAVGVWIAVSTPVMLILALEGGVIYAASRSHLSTIGFKELQGLTKGYSKSLNAFFKTGKLPQSSRPLEIYKENILRYLNRTGGSTKVPNPTAIKVQTERLKLINEALKKYY